MERGGHGQHHRAPRTLSFGDLDRALDRGLVARDDHLSAAIVVCGLAHLIFGGLARHGDSLFEVEAQERRHGASANRHRLLHGTTADAKQPGSVADAEGTRRRERRILSERMTGDELRVAREIDAGLGFEHPHGRERYRHQPGLSVLRQHKRLGRPFPDDLGERLAERLIDLLEHQARRREGIGKAPAHADRLTALARKNESERHARPLMRTGPKTPRYPRCQAEPGSV